MAAIRASAAEAVQSLQMRAVMFETTPASREDSRRALLDELARCDIVLLLLGADYGERTERGVSATEDELNEAQERGIPVIALVQKLARSAEQEAFVSRVRGTWSDGHFAPGFDGAGDVGLVVVAALNAWRQRGATGERQTGALERARALALGSGRYGQSHSGSKVRVVLVPVLARPIMVTLAEATLGDDLAMSLRRNGLVGHDVGLKQELVAAGVALETANPSGFERPSFLIARDGAIVAEAAVSKSGLFGSSVIEAPKVRDAITRACAFAAEAWARIDRRDDIRDLAVTVAIPDASMKVYSDTEFSGSSLRMGSGLGGPAVIVAPQPARLARREALGSPELTDLLAAEVRHAFQLEGRLRA